jgi:hypothetical protein
MGGATTLQLSILRSFRKLRLWPPRVRLCSTVSICVAMAFQWQ